MRPTARPPPIRLASLFLLTLAIGACAGGKPPASKSSRAASTPHGVINKIVKNISAYCTAPPPQRVVSDHGFYVSDDINTPQRDHVKINNHALREFIKTLMNMELDGKIRKFFAAFSTTLVGANIAVAVVSCTMSVVIIIITVYYCITYRDHRITTEMKSTDIKRDPTTEPKTDQKTAEPLMQKSRLAPPKSTARSAEKSKENKSQYSAAKKKGDSKAVSAEESKSRPAAGKDTPTSQQFVPGTFSHNGQTQVTARGVSAMGVEESRHIAPIPPGPNEETPLKNDSVSAPPVVTNYAYRCEEWGTAEALADINCQLRRYKLTAMVSFVLIVACVVGASLLFGGSIMAYLNTEATRVSLVLDQIDGLQKELAKIACQSSPPELERTIQDISKRFDDKIPVYMNELKARVDAVYPSIAYTKWLNATMINSHASLFRVIHGQFNIAVSLIADGSDADFIAKLTTIMDRFWNISSALKSDWDKYGNGEKTLDVFLASLIDRELRKISSKAKTQTTALGNTKFIRDIIVDNIKPLTNRTYFEQAVHESGLYGNPYWTYLTFPIFIVFALAAFSAMCVRLQMIHPRVFYSAAIVSCVCASLSAIALNHSIGGLQNACHYLENGLSDIENATLSVAASKWNGFKHVAGSSVSQCSGQKTYGQVFGKTIQHVVNKKYDGILDRAMKSVNEVSFSMEYLNGLNGIEAKLAATGGTIGKDIDYILRMKDECVDKSRANFVCGLNATNIRYSDEPEFITRTAAIVASLNKTRGLKNGFNDAIAPLREMRDLAAFKSKLRADVRVELKASKNETEMLLRSKMNAECHFTTIYHNIVRRACDPIMKPSNALVNVNYVVAFGFPLCGLAFLMIGCASTLMPRREELKKRKERADRALAEGRSAMAQVVIPERGDMQAVEKRTPIDFTDPENLETWNAINTY